MTEKIHIRSIKAKDLFSFLKIANKIGAQEIFEKFTEAWDNIQKSPKNKDSEEADYVTSLSGFADIAGLFIENLPTIEEDLNEFLGELTNMTAEEMSELRLDTYFNLIYEVFNKEEITTFFKSLSSQPTSDTTKS